MSKESIKDIIGKKFGRLTIVKELEPEYTKSGYKKRLVLCKCDCGNEVVKNFYELNRNNCSVKSCGCLSKEIAKENMTKYNKSEERKQRDISRFNYDNKDLNKERLARKRLSNIRHCMIARCYNTNSDSYKYYGEKGITVCDEWLTSLDSFVNWSLNNGYSDCLSLDRIDGNKPYSPENCRWVTLTEQMNNTSRNVYIKNKNGDIKTLAEWSRFYNIQYYLLHERYSRKKKDNVYIEDLI